MRQDLYVKNIPEGYSDDQLRRLFAVAGKVVAVHRITDPQNGLDTGCAYVTMASEAEAKEAIVCLDEAHVDSTVFKVKLAKPRAPRPSSSAGRGGGGRRRG